MRCEDPRFCLASDENALLHGVVLDFEGGGFPLVERNARAGVPWPFVATSVRTTRDEEAETGRQEEG